MTSTDTFVVHLASDLMLTSTVSGFASSAGVRFRSSADVTELAEAIRGCGGALLLIDAGLPGLDFQALADAVPAEVLNRAVAYGPHVHTEKLSAARDAGIGSVMSRGQFSARVGQLIRDFVASSSTDAQDG